ncbi:MAG TPA: hypothetical protein VEY94_14410 [Patescibacteria group bacterium]|nr:hypothetical protein [Patescibacteria group bacterium]
MSFLSQDQRAEEKLGQIIGRVGSVRTRLNSLALQHAVFYTLAIAIAAGAAIFATAFLLSPLTFLIGAAALILIALSGIINAIGAAWRMRTSALRAAAIADERAELKGRLSTIVALAPERKRGPLWAYLVEDTIGHQDQFAAGRIERRRVSRGIYPLLGALVLAGLAIPVAKLRPAPQIAAGNGQDDLTVDLDDLHLRPAEPGEESGMPVTADAATMRRLEEKMARDTAAGRGLGGNSLNQLVNRAREMAGNLQSKLTGQQSPSQQRLNLRLADAGNGQDQNAIHRAPDTSRKRGDVAGQFKQDQPKSNREINLPKSDDSHKQSSQQSSGGKGDANIESNAGKENPDQSDSPSDRSVEQSGENSSNGGETHGVGADPDSLFGAPVASKLGSEGFEIAIEARPVDHGAKGAGHAYVPPKVRTPLNQNQEPDEPVARAAVPADDRTTIKRVFER